jgi:hypothetical protein
MSEHLQKSHNSASEAILVARKALALAGVTGVAFLGGASAAKAERAGSSIDSKAKTYLVSDSPETNPVKLAKMSNRVEINLLREIRAGKQPAMIFNGAIRFQGLNKIYLGPVNSKRYRVVEDSNKPGEDIVSYNTLVVPVGDTVWAGVFWDRHYTDNIGQGSEYGNIGWIPLNEGKFTAYKNTWNGGPEMFKFHEVYVAQPQGKGAPTHPVYDLVVDGGGEKFPRADTIMDTEMWRSDYAESTLKAGGYESINQQEARALFASIGGGE